MTIDMDWDVVIVGRSYGALSTALGLARARWATLVVGEGGPRNESVNHTHGFLTRDGVSPAELIAGAEAELSRYPTVDLTMARVTSIDRVDGGFRIKVGPSTTTARVVVLATGVNDNPPPVPGLADNWGRGVFTCPFCDGYERADRPWALIGDEIDPMQVAMLRNWTDDLTVYAPSAVRRVHGDGHEATHLELADGGKVDVGAVFVGRCYTPNNGLAKALGCTLDDNGFVVVDDMRQTSVDGVYAVGDLIRGAHSIALAVADGSLTAGMITHRLLAQ